MKVLYLIDTLDGYGAERSIVQIALNMEEVVPVFIHLYNGDKLKNSLTRAGIKVYSLDIAPSCGYRSALNKISSIIEKESPQIIHSTLFRSNLVARKLKVRYPEIILVGSLVSNSYGKKRYQEMSLLTRFKLFTTQLRDRMSSKKVDYFICNSRAIMEPNIKALGIPKEKVRVIYRGRNFEDYNFSEKDVDFFKEECGLKGKKIFLNVSRLMRSKGQLDLLHAFKTLNQKFPESVLLMAGEGPLRSELEKKIKLFGLNSNVFLLGYREDIPELLAASDFFVFPSYYEGLPGALLEAIISRKPAIVSDIPENRECFNENGALLFSPGDVNTLTLKLKEALEKEDWENQVECSFQYAEKNFQIKNISLEYERFYRNILN